MSTKIFITGSYEEKGKIYDIIKEFEKSFEITYNWTNLDDQNLLSNIIYQRAQCIVREDAINSSDYLIVIMENPNLNYFDTIIEIGIAINSNVKVLIYNPLIPNTIYKEHPNIKMFDNILAIVEYISMS